MGSGGISTATPGPPLYVFIRTSPLDRYDGCARRPRTGRRAACPLWRACGPSAVRGATSRRPPWWSKTLPFPKPSPRPSREPLCSYWDKVSMEMIFSVAGEVQRRLFANVHMHHGEYLSIAQTSVAAGPVEGGSDRGVLAR